MDYNDIVMSAYFVGSSAPSFHEHKEFDLRFVVAHDRWTDFRNIIQHVYQQQEDDVVIICYDDHRFTSDYQVEPFVKQILMCANLGTQLLLGGCGGCANLVPVRHGLYWVDRFEHSSFYAVFRHAFQPILEALPEEGACLEENLSAILANKMLISPFVSKTASDKGYASKQLALFNYIINKYHIELAR